MKLNIPVPCVFFGSQRVTHTYRTSRPTKRRDWKVTNDSRSSEVDSWMIKRTAAFLSQKHPTATISAADPLPHASWFHRGMRMRNPQTGKPAESAGSCEGVAKPREAPESKWFRAAQRVRGPPIDVKLTEVVCGVCGLECQACEIASSITNKGQLGLSAIRLLYPFVHVFLFGARS